MDTPTLKKKAKNLKSIVGQYGQRKTDIYDVSEIITPKNIYILIPILVFLLLWLGKPDIILEEDDDEEKISKSKLVLYWVVFSFLLMVGYFGYNYKRDGEK